MLRELAVDAKRRKNHHQLDSTVFAVQVPFLALVALRAKFLGRRAHGTQPTISLEFPPFEMPYYFLGQIPPLGYLRMHILQVHTIATPKYLNAVVAIIMLRLSRNRLLS